MLFLNANLVPEAGWYFRKVMVGAILPALWKAPPHCLTALLEVLLMANPIGPLIRLLNFYFVLVGWSRN